MRIFVLTFCFLISSLVTAAFAQDNGVPLPPTRPANPSGGSSQSADGVSFIILPPRRPATIPAKQTAGSTVTTIPQTQTNTGTVAVSGPTDPATPPVLPAGCFDQLKALNVIFVEFPNASGAGECGLTDAVEVSGFDGIRLLPPAPMTCQIAVSMALWMRDSVVPEARERFGQYVVDVNQVSTYSCRSRPSGRLSEHAFGNAIDISGFRLANNTTIDIEPDWYGARKGRFLKAIAKTSCQYFSTVLTPLSDAAHQDHFHLDKGDWLSCDA